MSDVQSPTLKSRNSSLRPALQLLVGAGLLAAVWLTLLPAIANRPNVAARIRRLEEQGIDPSAIFYSELDAMPEIEERIRRVRNDRPNALW